MKLKPYPAYKDSGLPWLGRIPAHWEVRRNGRLFAQRVETGFPDLPILEVSLRTGVHVRDLDNTNRKQLMSNREQYKRAARGDIAYNMMRMWPGAVGVVPTDGLVSPAYVVALPFPETDGRYYSYLFRTAAYMNEVNKYSRGIVTDRNRLYWDEFKQMPSTLPPPGEQRKIADVLDSHNRRVRRFIRAKRRLIELLDEQKQVIVHRAVTRGFNPNVRLKPSGIDWLGDVPGHWEVLPIKRVLARLIDTEHKTAPAVDGGRYMVVRTSNIRNGRLILEDAYYTDKAGFCEWTRRGTPRPGDILFTREAPAGEACIVPDGIDLCMGQRVVLMRVKQHHFDPEFAILMLKFGASRDYIQLQSQGSTVPHFNMADIAAMPVLVPPLAEQREIVQALHSETEGIDSVHQRAVTEIDLIREYRTRLIADVVTGKLDVRGVELPALDETVELDNSNDDEDVAELDGELGEVEAIEEDNGT